MPNDLDVRDNGEGSASLYRTRWLLAHNRFHAVVHDDKSASEQWNNYLEELKTSAEVAADPA